MCVADFRQQLQKGLPQIELKKILWKFLKITSKTLEVDVIFLKLSR